MKLIVDWTTKQYRCHLCGTTKSVKYLMKVYDPVADDKPVEVAVCNKCALLHTEPTTKSKEVK
jgi:transcription elongation factor Elf1